MGAWRHTQGFYVRKGNRPLPLTQSLPHTTTLNPSSLNLNLHRTSSWMPMLSFPLVNSTSQCEQRDTSRQIGLLLHSANPCHQTKRRGPEGNPVVWSLDVSHPSSCSCAPRLLWQQQLTQGKLNIHRHLVPSIIKNWKKSRIILHMNINLHFLLKLKYFKHKCFKKS